MFTDLDSEHEPEHEPEPEHEREPEPRIDRKMETKTDPYSVPPIDLSNPNITNTMHAWRGNHGERKNQPTNQPTNKSLDD